MEAEFTDRLETLIKNVVDGTFVSHGILAADLKRAVEESYERMLDFKNSVLIGSIIAMVEPYLLIVPVQKEEFDVTVEANLTETVLQNEILHAPVTQKEERDVTVETNSTETVLQTATRDAESKKRKKKRSNPFDCI